MKKHIIAATVLFFLIIPFSAAYSQEDHRATLFQRERPPVALMVLDVVIVRPCSAVVSLGLTGLHVGISPLAYVTGVGEQSARILVEAPWRFTSMRPLG